MAPRLWDRLKALPKEAILREAGEALAAWLTDTGLTAEALEQRLLANEPILLQALATVREDDAARVRQLAARWVSQLGPADYPKVLQALAAYPQFQPHAHLLYHRYFWSHFVPAMETAKSWLTTPAAGTSGPPDPSP